MAGRCRSHVSLSMTPARPPCSRRALLHYVVGGACLFGPARADTDFQKVVDSRPSSVGQYADIISLLEREAAEAYANRDFKKAVNKLTELIYQQPTSPRYTEMRAQVLLDGKNFGAAVMDYNEAMRFTAPEDKSAMARLLAGRALALEGSSDFAKALKDYKAALQLSLDAGQGYDPYVVNSIGNCHASLEQYEEAREAYLQSKDIFQASQGFRDAGGRTTSRVDGAIFAASNAALMLAQLGDLQGATKELQNASRRGPGSVDARAALAALYYNDGNVEAAENAWEFACDKITAGCVKYRDPEWLAKVRRWPPVMVEMLGTFLRLQPERGPEKLEGAVADAKEAAREADEAPDDDVLQKLND